MVTLSLWDEELDVKRLQRRLELDEPIVEMFSNDARLGDLLGWGAGRLSSPSGVSRRVTAICF